MKNTEYDRLIILLENSNSLSAIEYAQRSRLKIPEYLITQRIPANEVWDIYSKRKCWNESISNTKRNKISGFDQLMSNLPKEPDRSVSVHDLKWPDVHIIVFTDGEISEYFGMLVFSKT